MKGVYNIKKLLIILIIVGLYNNIALFFSFEQIEKEPIEVEIVGEILSIVEAKQYVNKYIVKILEQNGKPQNRSKKVIIYSDKNTLYHPGDILNINGELERAEEGRNIYGFNYRNYLKKEKIYGIITCEKIHYLDKKVDIYYFLGKIQSSIKKQAYLLYGNNNAGFISKILFGFESELDSNVEENFRNAGISHILAISGLHISYIIIILKKIFSLFINSEKTKNLTICFCLIFFIILTGASPSCIRACFMNIMVLMSKNLYRKNNTYISLGIAFILIVSFNIFNIYDIGMWLSFFGTLGILLFYKYFIFIFINREKYITNNLISIFSVSLSAQILIWPIILFCYNTISFSFWITNVCISFLTGPLVIIGYLSIFSSYISNPLGIFIAKIEIIVWKVICIIANLVSKIPFSKIYVKGSNEILIIFYYAVLIITIIYYRRHKTKGKKHLIKLKRIINNKEYRNKVFYGIIEKSKRKLKNIFNLDYEINLSFENKENNYKGKFLSFHYKYGKYFFMCLLCIVIVITYLYLIGTEDFKLYFVDVGQGDCTIIKTQNKNLIIDGGEGNSDKYDYGKNVILQHLLKLGIKRIDYMIFSHFDSDHAGGLIYILENLKVDNIIIGIQTEESECLKKILEIADKKKIRVIIIESGKNIKIDRNSYIEALWPNKKDLIGENALNNNSLVFKFNYKNFSILFTGDIEDIAEKELVNKYKENLKSDVLKVSHHGSKTSTSIEFLEYVKPEIALIGVGKNNKFGHPNEDVIEKIENSGVKIYRTDINGEIYISINNSGEIKLDKHIK